MTALSQLLNTYRNAAASEREKGTYFGELIVCYLRNDATYKDLYAKLWTYADWAARQGLDKNDAGIDLVAHDSHRRSARHPVQAVHTQLSIAKS